MATKFSTDEVVDKKIDGSPSEFTWLSISIALPSNVLRSPSTPSDKMPVAGSRKLVWLVAIIRSLGLMEEAEADHGCCSSSGPEKTFSKAPECPQDTDRLITHPLLHLSPDGGFACSRTYA